MLCKPGRKIAVQKEPCASCAGACRRRTCSAWRFRIKWVPRHPPGASGRLHGAAWRVRRGKIFAPFAVVASASRSALPRGVCLLVIARRPRVRLRLSSRKPGGLWPGIRAARLDTVLAASLQFAANPRRPPFRLKGCSGPACGGAKDILVPPKAFTDGCECHEKLKCSDSSTYPKA